jgi:hypothetical protein
MRILRRILCVWVLISFAATSIIPPSARAQSASIDSSGLSFRLPKPGIRVNLSPSFEPVLIKGLKVHPENPFKFDFIVDPGDEKLGADAFRKVSQRMVNYFLASLTIPEKDLWVNLSPAEKNRIIPDELIKTELGRDLLAEDYMLKQVSSSLLYPETGLGKAFWAKVYAEAYRKFGVTEVPVNVVNKIWILPDRASVFEKGNTVYIVNARLKVMLEEDFLAQNLLNRKLSQAPGKVPVKDLSRQVLREIVVPAVEKEVNEDKNFAQLRQVYYALILAQWYQDVFKKSILNKIYSGQKKVAGIDVSDPKNRELIYRQYVSAYKKGVFNYIKEETDRVTLQPVPRKYFSGGVIFGRKVVREEANEAMITERPDAAELTVEVKPTSQVESYQSWNNLNRPLDLYRALTKPEMFKADGTFDREKLYAFIEKYSQQVTSQKLYPVQGAWPVLKAITLLEKSQEQDLVNALLDKYPSGRGRPALVDKILLMNNVFGRDVSGNEKPLTEWLKESASQLVGRRIYLLAAEIHHWAGGLGPVMKFHGKGMKDLGADVNYIEARYQYSINGTVDEARFDEVANGRALLNQLIGKGLVQEVSATEVKPNTRRTIQKYQVEKVELTGLNWNEVFKKLMDNGWAVKVGPSELQLTANLTSVEGDMSKAFGSAEDFGKIFRVLQRSDHVITDRGVQEIAGKDSNKLWDILKQPLDYKNSNIGLRDIKEGVDQYIAEMGDIRYNGVVVPQGLTKNPGLTELQSELWKALVDNGYIDSMGKILTVSKTYEEFLPGREKSAEKEWVFNTLKRLRDKGLHQTWVQVDTGIDENGITVYMFRDVLPDGLSSYYTKMLYNYKGRNNPVGKEESMAFINVAAAKLLERLEAKRMQEQGANWKPAVVHANDGQLAPLQAVTMSKYGSQAAIKDILWPFTTHTYRNRGNNGDVNWAINVFLKHMMGVNNRYINAFRQADYIDYTSGGVRLSSVATAVSSKHRDDVSGMDSNSILFAVTNGAVPEEMAKVFREEFDKLKAAGKISREADFERPKADEVALVKRASKERLNQANIRTANGGIVRVDLNKPLIGYERRLVEEKAGRNRAFTDDNIWMLVKLGYNVVLMGNHQGTEESEKLAAGLRYLEKKIDAEKISERADQYPGSFQFVQSFTPEEKKVFLAAADVQVQDSDEHTGANEFTEEDITANAGYQAGASWREGAIVDQGIPVDYSRPGTGQTLMPQHDTPQSWIDTVYKPLVQLWKSNRTGFYQNAALSPRLNRIQRYLLTSASYLELYNETLDRQQKQKQADARTQAEIIKALSSQQETIRGILSLGRNGVNNAFKFSIVGQGEFEARDKGLGGFVETKNKLENEFGNDALLHHYLDSQIQGFLRELFSKTPAETLLNDGINSIENSEESTLQKEDRLGRFVNDLEAGLKSKNADAAMKAPGGIKLDNIPLERHGQLTTDVVSNQALEKMYLGAQGLYGVIVGITPIPHLLEFIR